MRLALTKSKGFTLIEVLVTFLIISVGLLGLAALQASTVNEQFEAYQRVQVTSMLDDMAQRIRTNPAAAKAGDYTGTVSALYGRQSVASDGCGASPGAARDLCEWNRSLAGTATAQSSVVTPINIGGCIDMRVVGDATALPPTATTIRVSVSWRGMTSVTPPSNDCGIVEGEDDGFRRVAFRDVIIR